MIPIGFDFGTRHTRAARINASGEPEALQDSKHPEAFFLMPSIVRNGLSEILCGWDALPAKYSFQLEIPYLKKNLYDSLFYDESNVRQAHQVSAGAVFLLREAKSKIENALKEKIGNWVVPRPASASPERLRLFVNACDEAGLGPVKMLTECEAVLHAYRRLKPKQGVWGAFSCGGGFCDFAVGEMTPAGIRLLADQGESIGGEDMTRRIARNLLTEMNNDAGADFENEEALIAAAFEESEKAKMALSHRGSYDFNVRLPSGEKFQKAFSRYELALWIQDILERFKDLAERTCKAAGLKPAQIQGVFLSGAATRMPALQDLARGYFAQNLVSEINPELVAVYGAAAAAEEISK